VINKKVAISIFIFYFGLIQLASLQFILCYVAGFYEPTISQIPPYHLWDYNKFFKDRLEFSTIYVPCFDPNDECLKKGLHSVWGKVALSL
jgi:hypothetical protein